jgi:hypothetical protein
MCITEKHDVVQKLGAENAKKSRQYIYRPTIGIAEFSERSLLAHWSDNTRKVSDLH